MDNWKISDKIKILKTGMKKFTNLKMKIESEKWSFVQALLALGDRDISKIIFLAIAAFYAAGNFIWWILNTPVYPYGFSTIHFLDIFSSGYFFDNAPLLTYITKSMFFIFGKKYFDLIVFFINYIFIYNL